MIPERLSPSLFLPISIYLYLSASISVYLSKYPENTPKYPGRPGDGETRESRLNPKYPEHPGLVAIPPCVRACVPLLLNIFSLSNSSIVRGIKGMGLDRTLNQILTIHRTLGYVRGVRGI